jgi:hypothetical protein
MTDVDATAPDAPPAEQENRLDLDGLGPAFVNDPHPVLARCGPKSRSGG